jgi:hypothetical protein
MASGPMVVSGYSSYTTAMFLLSVHSHYGLHTHQVTFMTPYTGGFSRFVTFTTAPIAPGWKESCRGRDRAEARALCRK